MSAKHQIFALLLLPITVGLCLWMQDAVAREKLDSVPPDIFTEGALQPELALPGEQYLEMLLNRRYEELTQVLEPYLKPVQGKGSSEFDTALTVLGRTEKWLEKYFSEWVEATPDSAVPYLVRSNYYTEQGLEARGEKYLRETPRAQISEMKRLFKLSFGDIDKATSLNDLTAYPYAMKLNMAMRLGKHEELRGIYEAGIKRDPALYWLSNAYYWTQVPAWGGSVADQNRFLGELKRQYSKYPWLKGIELDVMIDDINQKPGEPCDKIPEYRKALEFHENSWINYQLGRAYSCNRDFKEALVYLRKSIEQWPHRAITWRLLGAIEHEKGRHDKAYDASRIATHLNPQDDFAFFQLGNIALYLEKYPEAEQAYLLASLVSPGNASYSEYIGLVKRSAADPNSPQQLALLTDDESRVASKTTYLHGKKNGQSIFYDEANRPREVQYFEDGKLKYSDLFHPDGYRATRLSVKVDLYSGPYWEYSPSGKVISLGTLDKGNAEGLLVRSFENGKPLYSGVYENGQKKGKIKFWVPSKQIDGMTVIAVAANGISHVNTPLSAQTTFHLKDGKPIYLYTAMEGLSAGKHEVIFKLYDSQGEECMEVPVSGSTEDGFNFYYAYYTPNKKEDQPGDWKAVIFLDGDQIATMPLTVL
ncbi:hypothetical protein BTA51_28200 [Hahella sp. CCB-MM4]|uniref:tetratricopeptide repeat protein n=1 Tax=Hahella sp. (strain CCB-MM4) TaxID=1926491 RepID=UPI000B9C0B1E|nr:hypothetical protein [Hahella sp. CCB-MM4]OZG70012.1 hypothetical protein BTA51_28200 [Hahella sp. CCB-MM4]